MDIVLDFLNGPAKFWHLLFVCTVFAIGWKALRDRLSATLEITIKIWDAVDPAVADEAEVTFRGALSSCSGTSAPRDSIESR